MAPSVGIQGPMSHPYVNKICINIQNEAIMLIAKMPKYLFCGGLQRWGDTHIWWFVRRLCIENDFIMSDYALLPQDICTFISDVHNFLDRPFCPILLGISSNVQYGSAN